MKKFLNFFLAAVVAVSAPAFVSCDSDKDDVIEDHDLTITLNLKDNLAIGDIEQLQVTATDAKGNTRTLDMTGLTSAQMEDLPQGQYTLALTGNIKDKLDAKVSGQASVNLYADATATIDVNRILSSPLVFKAIYAAGGISGYVKDQYFEIVNNSDEVQYLDGLILGAPEGNATTANAWQANGMADLYSCGQGATIAFPGSGNQYPLQPGESVLIANDATNHHEKAGEGNKCPDLSNADWEVYASNITGDIDYENVKNMDVIYQSTTYAQFGLGFFGRGYFIARLPQGMNPQAYVADKSHIMTEPGTDFTIEYLMIPSKYVLDAVDIWDSTQTEHYGTFLATDDAKGVNHPTEWSGQCIRRKVSKIENGRAYYQDTNNSANDFLTNQPLTPGQTPSVAD